MIKMRYFDVTLFTIQVQCKGMKQEASVFRVSVVMSRMQTLPIA